ncbi:MAG TPA: hypothetical protein VLU25_01035 [Acidobacteriota bacterium]|nr:hypothetical protein [Acidobacteriota bacterium]
MAAEKYLTIASRQSQPPKTMEQQVVPRRVGGASLRPSFAKAMEGWQ